MGGSVRAVRVATAAVAALAAVLLAAGPVRAQPVRVELTGDGVPQWQADAVAGAVAGQVARDRFRGVVVRGALAPDRLTWTIVVGGAVVKYGETALDGTTTRALAGTLTSELGRVLQPGEHHVAELPAQVGAADTRAIAALGVVAIFLLLPFVRGHRRGRAFRRTLAVIGALGGVALAMIAGRDYDWSWAIFVAGGVAWGGYAAVLIPVMFPALPGLDRVEHTELLGVLARWAVLSLQRIAMTLVVYAPFMVALAGACAVLDVPGGLALAVVVPAWGLCVRLWIQAWVEVAAARLDAALVDGDATETNPWHPAVRGYFLGYVRRVGWAADDRLVDGIRFLPGKGDAIVTYGGGTTHARIVVPRTMLEVALAPYDRPHDYAAPRVSTLHWTLWNAGLVMATELGAVSATREQRQPRTLAVEGDVDVGVLGEPATLAGIVEPVGLDPRPAYRPHEDPLWLDYDAGLDYDGTDAGDKDFLFGALMHELGRVRRHEDRMAALVIAARRLARRPRADRAIAVVERTLERQAEHVGDLHVGLNYARHHFVQYLAWKIWRREDLMTARARAPELARQSRVLSRMAGATVAAATADGVTSPGSRLSSSDDAARSTDDRTSRSLRLPSSDAAARATSQAERDQALEAWGKDTGGAPDLRARIARLARGWTPAQRARRWRRLALAVVAVAAVGGVAVAVARAVDYHATYEARIKPTTEPSDGEGK